MREPGVWAVARRPRWVAALFATLLVAIGFAALSQWQVSRAIEQATVISRPTEVVLPLASVATPQSAVTTASNGQRVRLEAEFVPDDYSVVGPRQEAGKDVYWVVGHAVTSDGVSIAVALGFADTETAARAAADSLAQSADPRPASLVGRYLATEASTDDDFQTGERRAMAVATLVNEWTGPVDTVYGGYLIAATAPASLSTIDSPAPQQEVELNWLNIFYAIEWVVFAGFAFYLWFRLVRDQWEREVEERSEGEREAELLRN
jgi:surfeit locus 1 family protein